MVTRPASERGLRGRQSLLGGALVLMLLATGCTFAGGSEAFAPQQVDVTLRDNAIDYQGPIRPGRVVFRAHNEGDADHDLALVELPEGIGDVDALINSDRPGVAPVYTTATRAPGEAAVFAVDLTAGRYALLGFGQDADGTPFYRKGMATDLMVGDPAGAQPTPSPSATPPAEAP